MTKNVVLAVCLALAIQFFPATGFGEEGASMTLQQLMSEMGLRSEDLVKKEIGKKKIFNPELRIYETQTVYEVWMKERLIPAQQLRFIDSGDPVYVVEKMKERWVNRPSLIRVEEDYLLKEKPIAVKVTSEGFEYITGH